MKRLFFFLLGNFFFYSLTMAFTGDIAKTSFNLDLDEIFPSPKPFTTDDGIDNVISYVIAMIPLLTTLTAIGATIMAIWGGFYMVMGGVNSEQSEKGKDILKTAITGLVISLLSYVIVTTLGNILDL